MENEYYFRQELENKMDEFLETLDGEFGWIGNATARKMADAAFSVLSATKDVQEYLIFQGELKS